MKTLDALKNVIKDPKSPLNDEKRPKSQNGIFEGDIEFSFSPNKGKDPSGLAELLSSNFKGSKQKTPTKKITKPITKKETSESFIKSKNPTDFSHTFKPAINPKSSKIVKNAEKEGRDLHAKRNDKLAVPEPAVETKKKKNGSLQGFLDRNYTQQLLKFEEKKLYQPVLPLDKLDEECTFKPSLDTKSRELAETHRIDLYEIGIRKLEEKKSNIEAHEKKKELEELKNCTFTPKILKKINICPKVDSRHTPDKKSYSTKFYRNASPLRVSIVDRLDSSDES